MTLTVRMAVLGWCASMLASGCAGAGSPSSDIGSENGAPPDVREDPWDACGEVAGWGEVEEEVEVLSGVKVPGLDPALEGEPVLTCRYAAMDASANPYGTEQANSLLIMVAPSAYFDHNIAAASGRSATVIDFTVALMRMNVDFACAAAESVGGSCEVLRDDDGSGSDDLVIARAVDGPEGSGTLSLIMARTAAGSIGCAAIQAFGEFNPTGIAPRTSDSFDDDQGVLRGLAEDACGTR